MMQLINILQVIVLITSSASATPIKGPQDQTPNSGVTLIERATPAPVSCGPAGAQRAWPLQSVQDAYNALVANQQAGTQLGSRKYPHQFGNPTPRDAQVVTALNAIPECKTGQAGLIYYEFPLTNPVFTADPPGPDRVVAITQATGPQTFTYCLAMTHRGASPPSNFLPCT